MRVYRGRAVVLLSGGLDSAVTLAICRRHQWLPYPLAFDYGQRNVRELAYAERQAKAAGLRLKVLNLPFSDIGGSSLVDVSVPYEDETRLVPGRNAVMFVTAGAYAHAVGATRLYVGVQTDTTSEVVYGAYDASVTTLRAVEWLINTSVEDGFRLRVVAPLVHRSKSDVLALAGDLGVDWRKTYSCMRGGPARCGQCSSCETYNHM